MGMLKRLKGLFKAEVVENKEAMIHQGSVGERELQEAYGTTSSALRFYNKQMMSYLTPLMENFIDKQEMMFISTADKKGECDSSVRFGERGFVTVIDKHYIIYPEFKGNGVMASMGNIHENGHIGLLFLDFFETKVGLHVNGKAKIIQKALMDKELSQFEGLAHKLRERKMQFKQFSYILIEIEEAYIHCAVHIPVLQKVEDEAILKTFPKGKGGDAFKVQAHK